MRLKLSSFLLALFATASIAQAQHFSFIVTGDGRSNGMPGRPGYDHNGINKTIMEELVHQVVSRKVKFIMFSGDLVLGYTDEPTFLSQLTEWRQIMMPVYNAGIHVYVVRGNHDAYNKSNDTVWNSVFSGKYALPTNGPDGEKNATWAAKEGNALILGLDDWGTHEHSVNQTWLDQRLASNRLPHIFAMGHEMAFKSGSHKDNLDNNERARDLFIESLSKAGARVYLAGHDHFYDHLEITDPTNHPGFNLHQFVVGTAGAPFYHGDKHDGHNGNWTVTPIKHIEQTYGYTLVEINGLHAKLTFMGRTAPGVYSPMDVFEYNAKK